MSDGTGITLYFEVEEKLLHKFYPLLQAGFFVTAQVGVSIKEYLLRQCLLDEDYITNSIQSIFLDGKPVDDIDTAVLQDGASLSLSGALPGLVGAVMRRGSPYASFRNTISYTAGNGGAGIKEGRIWIKLFNIVMRDIGPGFLERGIMTGSSGLAELLGAEGGGFWKGCRNIMLDGAPAGGTSIIRRLLSAEQTVMLRVRS